LELKNLTVKNGDPVKFQSRATGNPAPFISWFKDDEPLEMNNRIKSFQEADAYTLLILEAIAADSGSYECVAENAHGKVYTGAFLTVIGDKPIEEPKPMEYSVDQNNLKSLPLSSKFTQPSIEKPLSDLIVKEGSSAKFNCVINHSERKIKL
jgi:hypothetical protein